MTQAVARLMIERLRKPWFLPTSGADAATRKNFGHGVGRGETLAFAGHNDVVPAGDVDRWINCRLSLRIRDECCSVAALRI